MPPPQATGRSACGPQHGRARTSPNWSSPPHQGRQFQAAPRGQISCSLEKLRSVQVIVAAAFAERQSQARRLRLPGSRRQGSVADVCAPLTVLLPAESAVPDARFDRSRRARLNACFATRALAPLVPHLAGSGHLPKSAGMARVGWPGGISPPGSHRSRRDSLPSPGSSDRS